MWFARQSQTFWNDTKNIRTSYCTKVCFWLRCCHENSGRCSCSHPLRSRACRSLSHWQATSCGNSIIGIVASRCADMCRPGCYFSFLVLQKNRLTQNSESEVGQEIHLSSLRLSPSKTLSIFLMIHSAHWTVLATRASVRGLGLLCRSSGFLR